MSRFRNLLLKTVIAIILLGTIVPLKVNAQERRMPPRERPLSETIVSPEILPDNQVIFRILAPKANEVTVAGDFGNGTLTFIYQV